MNNQQNKVGIVGGGNNACRYTSGTGRVKLGIQPMIETPTSKSSELKELFEKVMKTDNKEIERQFFSYGKGTLPYLIEAFCSEDLGRRTRSLILLSRVLPWEIIERVRERYTQSGEARLTAEEEECFERKLRSYFDSDTF